MNPPKDNLTVSLRLHSDSTDVRSRIFRHALSNLGGARVGMGEYRVAEYDLRRIIRWAEIAGQGGWLSSTYHFLAEACLGQGKVGESLAAARRALVLEKKVGSPDLIGRAWRTLGQVLARAAKSTTIGDETWNGGGLTRGEAMWREARDLFARLGIELKVERMTDSTRERTNR